MRLADVEHLIVELGNLLFEDLVGILFPPGHALQLSEVLAIREDPLHLRMLVLEDSEFLGHDLDDQRPLLVQSVVFLELGAHVSFVLLVVRGDFRLALLVDLDFEPAFAGPLLP